MPNERSGIGVVTGDEIPIVALEEFPQHADLAVECAPAKIIAQICRPMLTAGPQVMVLSCAIDFGVSGAPVFVTTGDGPMLVAVVSAMGELPGGDALALAVTAEAHLEALRAALATR